MNGNKTITLTAKENSTVSPRNDSLMVVVNGLKPSTISLYQTGGAPFLQISEASFTCDIPTFKSFYIHSNTKWQIKNIAPWVNLNKTSGSGNDTIKAQIGFALGSLSTKIDTLEFEAEGINKPTSSQSLEKQRFP